MHAYPFPIALCTPLIQPSPILFGNPQNSNIAPQKGTAPASLTPVNDKIHENLTSSSMPANIQANSSSIFIPKNSQGLCTFVPLPTIPLIPISPYSNIHYQAPASWSDPQALAYLNKLKPDVLITRKLPAPPSLNHSTTQTSPFISLSNHKFSGQSLANSQENSPLSNPESRHKKLKKIKQPRQNRGAAYMRRNVYKSIIRHMNVVYTRNKESLTKILEEAGFSSQKMKECFETLEEWGCQEKTTGTTKRSQATIEKVLASRSPLTFVLREALKMMMNKWETGRVGRISGHNFDIYQNACQSFYKRTIDLTGSIAQISKF